MTNPDPASVPPGPTDPTESSVRDRIARILADSLAPERLDIVDDSARHAGHGPRRPILGDPAAAPIAQAADAPVTETHVTITLVSAAFAGHSRLERHRRVITLLAPLLAERIHALSLVCLTPQEAQARAG